MENLVVKISRVVFGLVLVVVAFVALEIVLINQHQAKQQSAQMVVLEKQTVAIKESGAESIAGQVTTKETAADARPLLIKRYLEKYKSPLVPYSDMIFKLSETYGFEYYWIVAIAQQESNLCKKIPEGSHNCWGYGIHKRGTLMFDNYELALKSYAEYLKREYFDKGLNTPELIMKKYCPSSNGSWAYGVNKFINDIETGKL